MSSASAITPSPATGGFTEASFEAFLKGRDEPTWLLDRRRQAFEAFSGMALPSSREEEWRRTDIRGFKLDAFDPPTTELPSAAARESFDAEAVICIANRKLTEYVVTGMESRGFAAYGAIWDS